MSLDDDLADWAAHRQGAVPDDDDVASLLEEAARPRPRGRVPSVVWLFPASLAAGALALAAAALVAVGWWATVPERGPTPAPVARTVPAPPPAPAVVEPWTGEVVADGATFTIDGTLTPQPHDPGGHRYALEGRVTVEAEPRGDAPPLAIVADGWRVTVVGTVFTVDSDPFAVAVTEGVVSVTHGADAWTLKAGDRFVNGKVEHPPAPSPAPAPDLGPLKQLVRDGALDDAAAGLASWLDDRPRDAEAWRLLALVEQRRDRPRAAVTAWRAVVAHGPPAQAQRARYEAATLLGPTAEAVPLWEAFLATPDPLAPEARLALGEALLAGGDDRGWSELERVVDEHPGTAAAGRARARLATR